MTYKPGLLRYVKAYTIRTKRAPTFRSIAHALQMPVADIDQAAKRAGLRVTRDDAGWLLWCEGG